MKNFFAAFIAVLCMVAVTGVFLSISNRDEQASIAKINEGCSNEVPDESPPINCSADKTQSTYMSTLYGKILDVPIYYICKVFSDSENKSRKKRKKKNKKTKDKKNKR